jgi:hypothetical protein
LVVVSDGSICSKECRKDVTSQITPAATQIMRALSSFAAYIGSRQT